VARGASKPGFKDLKRQALDTGDIGPVYVLVGEDQLRLEAAVEVMRRHVLDPAAAAFNERILRGDQVGWQDVLQAAQGFPMMGDRQLIWLKNLEALDKATNKDDPGLKALESYLESPAPSTVLILSGEKIDGRKKWATVARKKGYLFSFEPPSGRDLHEWIDRAARREGLSLDNDAMHVLADLVGNDLRALAADIAKLALISEGRERPLTAEELPGLVMDQADLEVFSLTDGMVGGQPAEVLRTWWRLQAWGSDAYKLTPLVASHLRRVALTAAAAADGASPDQAAASANLNAWMVKNKLAPHARRMGSQAGRKLLKACLECERAQKSRPVPPETAFEQLLLTVATQDGAD